MVFPLSPDNQRLGLSNAVDSLLNVVFLDQCEVDFSVELQEHGDILNGFQCLNTVVDSFQVLLKRADALVGTES
jgi:hypothetical protein